LIEAVFCISAGVGAGAGLDWLLPPLSVFNIEKLSPVISQAHRPLQSVKKNKKDEWY